MALSLSRTHHQLSTRDTVSFTISESNQNFNHLCSHLCEASKQHEPSGIAEVYVDTWMNHNDRSFNVVTPKLSDGLKGLFELTPSQILKLKLHANSKVKVNVHPSTFSVTCAYVLACLVKVRQVKEDTSKDEGVLNGAERWVSDMNEFMEGRISIVGFPRFEVYNIDFGCGRPKKVDLSSIGEEAFSLNESRDIHGGVEIGGVQIGV
ncbi:unnamed protein product [Sphenostylis stenocarpa]|uniref:Uncharacterized protein n=1 Tax=Sphenostylis stenocarpa TaxID=92480 RepID=A0AA86VAD4_9FABA|nr:unnamed protein product [Sphenostylis stenocarpa]